MMPGSIMSKVVTPSAVPFHSHFVLYSDHRGSQMHMWPSVYVGTRLWEWTEAAYAWCDVHVQHAWTVKDDHFHFSDLSDAAMFTLAFM